MRKSSIDMQLIDTTGTPCHRIFTDSRLFFAYQQLSRCCCADRIEVWKQIFISTMPDFSRYLYINECLNDIKYAHIDFQTTTHRKLRYHSQPQIVSLTELLRRKVISIRIELTDTSLVRKHIAVAAQLMRNYAVLTCACASASARPQQVTRPARYAGSRARLQLHTGFVGLPT